MKQFLSFLRRGNQHHQESIDTIPDETSTTELNNPYTTDSPVSSPEQDRFKRWSFSQRVAQTIVSRRDVSSLVIGIYGPWGEGKTTTLNFIEKKLKESPNIICIKFNPWRFTDEATLIKSFFESLAEAIEKSIASPSEKVAEWVTNYLSALTVFSLDVGGIKVNPGQGLQEVIRPFSFIALEESKKRLESLLKDKGKRVVVLMDDIDRLDKNEIQVVFKLVKLSADFDYTVYVLAFDEMMVASALSEKYGSGDIKAGRSFLEKIIQVPLSLPKADRVALLEYCIEGIYEALKDADIQISEEQFRYCFLKPFMNGLEIRLRTPRMVKRYINALAFSLPILKGEVNPLDLMLVEGMRLFYPEVYDSVKSHPDIFLGPSPNLLLAYDSLENYKKRSVNIIEEGIKGLTPEESAAAKNLLQFLFPYLSQAGVLSETSYIPVSKEKDETAQRVSSPHYFARFFSYSILDNDIPDEELNSFLLLIKNASIETIASNIHQIIGEQRAELFVLKINSRTKEILLADAQKLILAIAMVGDSFLSKETLIKDFSGIGILIEQLFENIKDDKTKLDTAKQIVLETKSIPFALECFEWIAPSSEELGVKHPLSAEQSHIIRVAFAEKIKEISQTSPLYLQFPDDALVLFYIWSNWGDKEEVKQYCLEVLNKHPESVVEFLKCCLPKRWSSAYYGARKGDFERYHYNILAEYVDPSFIYHLLQSIYGSSLDNPKNNSDNQQNSLEERVINQFTFIHQIVLKDLNDGNKKSD